MGGCFSSDEWQLVVREERDVVYSKLFYSFITKKKVTIVQGVSGNDLSKSDLGVPIFP